MPTNESHTAGWALAAEMCRWMQLRTIEYHPGGGQNDCLRLTTDGHFLARQAQWQTYAFDINLGGSIHIIESPIGDKSGLVPQETWVDAYRQGELRRLAHGILQSTGFDPAGAAPTYAEGLTVQVAAAILRICANDASDWKIRSVWLDDHEGLNRCEEYNSPFPEMAPISESAWVVLRDDQPQAWLALGWLWTKYGERRDLMAERGRGRPIDDLAKIATRPRPKTPLAAEIFTTLASTKTASDVTQPAVAPSTAAPVAPAVEEALPVSPVLDVPTHAPVEQQPASETKWASDYFMAAVHFRSHDGGWPALHDDRHYAMVFHAGSDRRITDVLIAAGTGPIEAFPLNRLNASAVDRGAGWQLDSALHEDLVRTWYNHCDWIEEGSSKPQTSGLRLADFDSRDEFERWIISYAGAIAAADAPTA